MNFEKNRLEDFEPNIFNDIDELQNHISQELGISDGSRRLQEKKDRRRMLDHEIKETVLQSEVNSKTAPNSTSKAIGEDLWKQMQRVSIPEFNGNKKSYENWKAAFVACTHNAPATPEYKLSQLRQYLSYEALQVIGSLGHSAFAYAAANDLLDRKYGGSRRKVTIQLKELDKFRPMSDNNPKEFEKFADLLNVVVITLKEADRTEELGNGSLYAKLQKKMTEKLLAQYQRCLFERGKEESVEALREWVFQESEFQTIAQETVRGVTMIRPRFDL
ncbi:hypothetical protein SNE40_001569 [Patella caerulea]|uniref:Uncharacterized protein n=1 Tax=Patella caerulea TaxID=87958 RepID=A0AAN8KP18_PATCE